MGVDGKGDAICRGGIIKEFFMDLADLFFGDEMDDEFLSGNLEEFKQKRDCLFHMSNGKRQISLGIDYRYQTVTGVLGKPVTLVFSPSFHFPMRRRTSTRSKRFKTLRFLAVLLDFP